MSRNNETINSTFVKENRPASASKQRDVTVEEVLMWEAT
jgi:hypothetical protein